MARKLMELQKAVVFDPVTKEKLEFTYRQPNYLKRVEYANKLHEISQDKNFLMLFPQTRIEYGKEILAGIPENYFSIQDKAISSDPASENFMENWKELIEENAPELIAALAESVFEAENYNNRMTMMEKFLEKGMGINIGEAPKKKTGSASS